MGRIAILQIRNGTPGQGLEVSFQVAEDGGAPEIALDARLPENTGIKGLYECWRESFCQVASRYNRDRHLRVFEEEDDDDDDIIPEVGFSSHRSYREEVIDCREWYQKLFANMQVWLQASPDPKWQRIREQLQLELGRNPDGLRVVIQANEPALWKLPWFAWDVLQAHPQVGIAYAPLEFEKAVRPDGGSRRDRVRILAVFGNSSQIDLEPDRLAIRSLEGVEVEFLDSPDARSLIQTLRDERGWDIFFFAGHSGSDGETGQIEINENESLEIDQFQNAVGEAISHGLKIAIFNSCDGLGLAQRLAHLRVPAIVVMQEIVPDVVAQSFLTEFLREYAGGRSLYASVRRSRERLEAFADLPGATGLPIVFQHPAEVPPTWEELRGGVGESIDDSAREFDRADSLSGESVDGSAREFDRVGGLSGESVDGSIGKLDRADGLSGESVDGSIGEFDRADGSVPEYSASGSSESGHPISEFSQSKSSKTVAFSWRQRLQVLVAVSVAVTGVVMGVRWWGKLQAWELMAFDRLMRQLPAESADSRLLLVGVDEEDIREYGHPLPDPILARLLQTLQGYQPSAIGLDIVRDGPVPGNSGVNSTAYAALVEQFQQNPDLIGVCTFGTGLKNSIAHLPEVSELQVGFADLYYDTDFNPADETTRRYLLSRLPNPIDTPSRCTTNKSFAWKLVYRHLIANGVEVDSIPEGWRFGSVAAKRLKRRSGGYQTLDARGDQVIIRYRNTDRLAQEVSVREVLENRENFNPEWVKGRIVLIGMTAASVPDVHDTPYGKMRGLYVHGHVVSQILSAIDPNENRPFLWYWFQWGDALWVFFWSLAGGIAVTIWSVPVYRGLAIGISGGVLYGLCWFVLTKGGWIPLVPSVLALVGTAVVLSNGKWGTGNGETRERGETRGTRERGRINSFKGEN